MEFKSCRSTNNFSAYFDTEFQCDCCGSSPKGGDALNHELHKTLPTFADMESQSFKNLHLLDEPLLLQKDTESYMVRIRKMAGKYMGYPRINHAAAKDNSSNPSISLSALLSTCDTLNSPHRIDLLKHLNSNDMFAKFLQRARQQFPEIFPSLAFILALISEYHHSMVFNCSLQEINAMGKDCATILVLRASMALCDLGVKQDSLEEVAQEIATLGLELLEGWLGQQK